MNRDPDNPSNLAPGDGTPSAPTPKRPSSAVRALVALAAVVVVIAGIRAAKTLLMPLLLSAFIAVVSTPTLFFLKKRRVPTWLALTVVVMVVLLALIGLAALIGSSASDFYANLPIYQMRLKAQVTDTTAWLSHFGIHLSGQNLIRVFDPGAAMKLAANLVQGLGNVLTDGFLILLTVIFMLLEASGFSAKLDLAMGGTHPGRFDAFLDNVKQYMAIKTALGLVTGAAIAIWLAILGIDYAMLWGVLAFALNFIPTIGAIIAAVPAVLLALIQVGLLRAGLAGIGYLVINIAMGNMIEPRLMGRRLGLSPLVVFLSLLFWGWVLGPVGMLLSVPLTMTAKIALESREETVWLAILLGTEPSEPPVPQGIGPPPPE